MDKQFLSSGPSSAKSRSGWIVYYANCSVSWASKLQTQVALSTTEADYIAMSFSLRDVIPIMDLVAEVKNHNFQAIGNVPHVFCKVLKDNADALEPEQLPKLHPCTKHINVCYHQCCEHVYHGKIKISPISTSDQIADSFTKALNQNIFIKHHTHMWGQSISFQDYIEREYK